LREAFEIRQKCDYREFVEIEKEQVEEVLVNADDFVAEARRVLTMMRTHKGQ